VDGTAFARAAPPAHSAGRGCRHRLRNEQRKTVPACLHCVRNASGVGTCISVDTVERRCRCSPVVLPSLLRFFPFWWVQVDTTLATVCDPLGARVKTVQSKLAEMRAKLLEFAPLLPFAGKITAKNVGSYAGTIMRLSGMMESPAELQAGNAVQALAPRPTGATGAPAEQGRVPPSQSSVGAAAGKRPRSDDEATAGVPAAADPAADAKRRRQQAGEEPGLKQKGADQQEAPGPDNGDDEGLGSEDDVSETEIAGYIRSAEEVELFKIMYAARSG